MTGKSRKPMGKGAAAAAYQEALATLEPHHARHFYGIREFVRCLRAEAAASRKRLREEQIQTAFLKIELEETAQRLAEYEGRAR